MQTDTGTDIRDCWHNDITHIVNARGPARLDRKEQRRRSYVRFRDRLPHVHRANLLASLPQILDRAFGDL